MGPELILGLAAGSLVALAIWTAITFAAGIRSEQSRTEQASENLERVMAERDEWKAAAQRSSGASADLIDHHARVADAATGNDWVSVYPEHERPGPAPRKAPKGQNAGNDS